ncbi:MAG TPA: caspase family protein [Flavobacteriales bacterium]|nr:caspase family protein [Flavobacteriales bacterium]
MKIIFACMVLLFVCEGRSQNTELLLQKGHSNRINVIEFSPKGNFLATGGEDNLVLLTDVLTGTTFKTLHGHTEPVRRIVFTRDGKKMVTCSKLEIIVWDLETEKKLFAYTEMGVEDYEPAATVNPEGTLFIFTAKDGREYGMSMLDGKVSRIHLPQEGRVLHYEYTADSKLLLLICESKVYVMDAKTYEQKFIFGTQQQAKAYFITRDGKYYYCANAHVNWQKWDMATGKMLESRRGRADKVNELREIEFVVVNKEHTIMGVYEKKLLSFYDLWSGVLLKQSNCLTEEENERNDTYFQDAKLNDAGKVFIGAMTSKYDHPGKRYSIRYIDTRSGRVIRETLGFKSSVAKVSVSPDDRHLCILPIEDDNQETRIWEMDKAGGRMVKLAEQTQYAKSVYWSPDSKVTVTGEIMTDLGTGDFHDITSHFSYKEDAHPTGNAISPDYKLMAGIKRVVDYTNGKPLCMIDLGKDYTSTDFLGEEGNGDLNHEKTFTPDNKNLLVLKKDSKTVNVNIYNIEQCNKTGILTIETGVNEYENDELQNFYTVTASSNYFVLGLHSVHVYDLQKQEKIIDIPYKNQEKISYGLPRVVNNIAVNAKENLMAVAYADTTIVIYAFPSGKKLQTLRGHDLAPTSVCFKNNSDILVSAGPDSKIIFWNPLTGEQLGNLAAIDSTDFIITTPEGYYFATRGALKKVAFRSNKKIFPFEQFDLKYNRPDKVFKKLELANDKQIKMYNLAYQKRLKKAGFTEEMLGSDFHLPVAEIKNMYTLPLVKYDDTLGFNLTASDNLYGIDRINIYVNDVAVYGSSGMKLAGKPKQVNKKLNLVLSAGLNHVQVSVTNEKGVESLREVFDVNCEMEKKPDLYMLVVGVSEFKEAGHNLKYAAKDATDLANAFRNSNRFGKVVIKELKNAEATKDNILKAAKMFEESKEDDLVILHMSSHGVMDEKMDYYLATPDMVFTNPAERGLPYTELENTMEKALSRNRLMLIDACHSGEVDKEEMEMAQNTSVSDNKNVKLVTRAGNYGVAPRLGLTNSFAYMQVLFDDVSKGMGATVIAAAGGMEYALESSDWNNGVFTYSILSGLKSNAADFNGDGIIRIDELKEYVTYMVVELTAGRQVPNARKENLNNNFIIK